MSNPFIHTVHGSLNLEQLFNWTTPATLSYIYLCFNLLYITADVQHITKRHISELMNGKLESQYYNSKSLSENL